MREIINTDLGNDEKDFLSFSKTKDGKFNPENTVLAAVPVYSGKVLRVLNAGSNVICYSMLFALTLHLKIIMERF